MNEKIEKMDLKTEEYTITPKEKRDRKWKIETDTGIKEDIIDDNLIERMKFHLYCGKVTKFLITLKDDKK